MPTSLAARYNPKEFEPRIYRSWEERKLFAGTIVDGRKPFTIVIPPPNVTGILTIGHVLNNTLQDILIRYHKLLGDPTLWLPGMDHAGIATQVVVEEELQRSGTSRQELGREKFVAEVWKWKDSYGNRIREQLKRMGCACDWDRERFTLDAGLSRAVTRVFVELYRRGLIYRGTYIVNWCPRCGTAISDEQVEYEEQRSKLWYLRYPRKDGAGFVTVATTRPETMLGDTAVAVNPGDPRYRDLVGTTLVLPLVGREIPVIADPIVDPAFGTGAVKVTPAHDPNDFEIARRHQLAAITVIGPDAKMTEAAGACAGLDRADCRARVVADLAAQGLLEKTEDYTHAVGTCERCHTAIEPSLSRQWFVRMQPLAAPALAAVREGRVRFYPERWQNLYYHWMENVRDWCISRQLWWGHRIPVYYCQSCNEMIVAETRPDRCPVCSSPRIVQDEDVLDTWFSSWLWPFSTLGWPDATPELGYYYPTSVLATAWDIIYLWVARMIMAGLAFPGRIPFDAVVFHPMIRDEKGRRMSKSLGNSPDPIQLIDEYGADGLRLGLLLITPREQDVIFTRERIESGRNFCNKLWNAARFLDLKRTPSTAPAGTELPVYERWILDELNRLIGEVTADLDRFDFNAAARRLYEFTWHEFCDWYLEFAKPRFATDGAAISATGRHVLGALLRLLHPFIPFITEEVWQRFGFTPRSILEASWPTPEPVRTDDVATVTLLKELATAVRTIRSEMGVPAKAPVSCQLRTTDDALYDRLAAAAPLLGALAGIDRLVRAAARPDHASLAVVGGLEVYVPLVGLIDLARERARLTKELNALTGNLATLEARLANDQFRARAEPSVIERESERHAALRARIDRIRQNLDALA